MDTNRIKQDIRNSLPELLPMEELYPNSNIMR